MLFDRLCFRSGSHPMLCNIRACKHGVTKWLPKADKMALILNFDKLY